MLVPNDFDVGFAMARILVSNIGVQMQRYSGDLRSQVPKCIQHFVQFHYRALDVRERSCMCRCELCQGNGPDSLIVECCVCGMTVHTTCQKDLLSSGGPLDQKWGDKLHCSGESLMDCFDNLVDVVAGVPHLGQVHRAFDHMAEQVGSYDISGDCLCLWCRALLLEEA
jgi:hypothetical protein